MYVMPVKLSHCIYVSTTKIFFCVAYRMRCADISKTISEGPTTNKG